MHSLHGLLDVLNVLGCGAVLLDRKGRVLQTNEKAQRYLGLAFDITLRASSRTGAGLNADIQTALREALKVSSQVLPQLGEYITVPRPDARPLLLRSVQLKGEDVRPDEVSMAALILLDMDDCPFPDDELLREVFLMTPAEIRLAQRLSRGESLASIAKHSGLSAGTLRVQLKRLFMKTGTSRQGELIALLAHMTRLNTNETGHRPQLANRTQPVED